MQLQLADRAVLDCTVRADPLRLKQVLLNLLGNAIKYNRRDGQVTVQGSLERRTRRSAGGRHRHRPDGRPAPAPVHRFERLSARQSGVEGTGIGLALSRQLMLAMGGEIGADSVLDVGSTFWIRLPQRQPGGPRRAAATHAALSAPRARAQRRHRVLYVEDNPVNALLMRAMLARLPTSSSNAPRSRCRRSSWRARCARNCCCSTSSCPGSTAWSCCNGCAPTNRCAPCRRSRSARRDAGRHRGALRPALPPI